MSINKKLLTIVYKNDIRYNVARTISLNYNFENDRKKKKLNYFLHLCVHATLTTKLSFFFCFQPNEKAKTIN